MTDRWGRAGVVRMRVDLIAAQSIDGFITKHEQAGTGFTSEADRAHFASLLDGYDCSVMGATTFEASRTFICERLTRRRLRVVLTRRADAFADLTVDGELEFSGSDPRDLVNKLSRRGYRRCALLGGSQVHALFLGSDLVDRLVLTVEGRIFGEGRPLAPGRWDLRFTLERASALGPETALLEFRRRGA